MWSNWPPLSAISLNVLVFRHFVVELSACNVKDCDETVIRTVI